MRNKLENLKKIIKKLKEFSKKNPKKIKKYQKNIQKNFIKCFSKKFQKWPHGKCKKRIFLPRRGFESTASLANEVNKLLKVSVISYLRPWGPPTQNFCTPKNFNIWGCFNLLLTLPNLINLAARHGSGARFAIS